MNIVDEKYMEFHYDELDLSVDQLSKMCQTALELIKGDKRTLIEYYINKNMTEISEKFDIETTEKEKLDKIKNYVKIRM